METTTRRTKVVYLITKSNFGGAQKYVYELATSLPRQDFDVQVILGGTGVLVKKLEQARIPVTSIPYLERNISFFREFKIFFKLYFLFRKIKPDVAHVNSSKIGGIGSFSARLAGVKKIIFTAHGWAFNENRPFITRQFFKFLHWLTLLFSHHTIAVSEQIKKQVRHFPFVQKKIVVIHNAIKSPAFLTHEEALRNLFSKGLVPETFTQPDSLIFGCIAELHHVKGLSYLIDSFSWFRQKHKNVYLLIIGSGDEFEKLKQQVSIRGLEDSVSMPGFIDNGANYMKIFNLFILPSISEALGIVLLEAGYACIPVIASRVGGIPEIITDGENGRLFPSKNAQMITEIFEEYISDPSIYTNYAYKLHQKVRQEFNYEKMLEKTIDLYI